MTAPTPDEAQTARWLGEASTVTVLTGAGVSTASGIPDFRGPQGVWTKNPAAQSLFTIGNYLADPDVRRQAWQARRTSPLWDAEPNPAHRSLVELERDGRLEAIVTQNIDGLHQEAGSSPEKVIEIHGTARRVSCLTCGDVSSAPEILARLEAGETDPECRECGGILKSATISFGQALNRDVLDAAVDASLACELFMAVGTSLTVHPAAGLCDYALSGGARLVIVNAEATPYDDDADVVLRDPISEVLPRLVAATAR